MFGTFHTSWVENWNESTESTWIVQAMTLSSPGFYLLKFSLVSLFEVPQSWPNISTFAYYCYYQSSVLRRPSNQNQVNCSPLIVIPMGSTYPIFPTLGRVRSNPLASTSIFLFTFFFVKPAQTAWDWVRTLFELEKPVTPTLSTIVYTRKKLSKTRSY